MGSYWLIDSVISVVIVLKTLQPSTTFYNVTLSRDGSGQGDERGFLSKIGRKVTLAGNADSQTAHALFSAGYAVVA